MPTLGVRNRSEIGQIQNRKTKNMMRMITTAIGLFGVLIGMGLILPALAKVRDLGEMPSAVVMPYTVGVVIVVVGICTTAFGLMKRKAA
jgi:uncharacterized membrane protein